MLKGSTDKNEWKAYSSDQFRVFIHFPDVRSSLLEGAFFHSISIFFGTFVKCLDFCMEWWMVVDKRKLLLGAQTYCKTAY